MPKKSIKKLDIMKLPNQSAFKQKFYDKKKLMMEIVPLAILIVMFAIAFYVYPTLPAKVPIHWNAAGQVDNYGSKFIAVFLIPIIFLLFAVFAFMLPAMDVFKENIKSFYNYYYALKILLGVFFLIFYIATLAPNFGYVFNMSYVVIIAIIALFFILGYIMRHIKRNFFIGIRTPWTLTNDYVWERTHNQGGILFMLFSIILLIALLYIEPFYLYIGFIVLLVLIVIYLTLYSYFLYRKVAGK